MVSGKSFLPLHLPRRLENEIEMLKEAAFNYKSLAKQSEIDDIHNSVENLNRSIACLKCESLLAIL